VGKYVVPKWAKEVRKNMIDLDMSVVELAKSIGRPRVNVSKVLTGSMMCEPLQNEILSFIQDQKKKVS